MNLKIEHQDSYSRGELLLRSFFGAIYIGIPHMFVMMFVGIWANILSFLCFFSVLFAGKWPKSWFEFLVKFMNWGARYTATVYNLVDGYPAIGVNGTSDKVSLDVPHPDSVSRGLVILRILFGALYVGIPHAFCLYFRAIASMFLMMLAWWAVLFTGKYPEKWHAFNVGTLRWYYRIMLYIGFYTDEYPPFSGKE
ncbi:MAG: DUF4389 domain-containing protein [Spirochaetes bacterium]|nr:DUF4389 domain-containing protein [Spirochaetota bacterium]